MKTSTNNKEVFVEESIVDVYPNPSSNKVQFMLQDYQANSYNLTIYNVAGMLVQQVEFDKPSYELKGGQLEHGLYIYKLAGPDGQIDTGTFILEGKD